PFALLEPGGGVSIQSRRTAAAETRLQDLPARMMWRDWNGPAPTLHKGEDLLAGIARLRRDIAVADGDRTHRRVLRRLSACHCGTAGFKVLICSSRRILS